MKRVGEDGRTNKIQTGGTAVKKTGHQGHWTNEDVIIIDKSAIHVPLKLIQVMESLNSQFSGLEYSIFCKATYDGGMKMYVLSEEYFIPKQKVTSVSVNYEEDIPDDSYNCVIHKHPRGCMSFSGTDNTYINQNFDLSLLWVNGKFHIGQVRLKTELGRIKLPLDIYSEKAPGISLPAGESDKIIRDKTLYAKPKGDGVTGQGNFFQRGGFCGLDESDFLDVDSAILTEKDKKLLESMMIDEHF